MIINLTQHTATQEQCEAGVVDLPVDYREELIFLLTFESLPSREILEVQARTVARLAQKIWNQGPGKAVIAALESCGELASPVYACQATLARAMIGGAPFFMSALEKVLIEAGIQPIYAFSIRESVEEPQPDGSVRKVNIFKHKGFVF